MSTGSTINKTGTVSLHSLDLIQMSFMETEDFGEEICSSSTFGLSSSPKKSMDNLLVCVMSFCKIYGVALIELFDALDLPHKDIRKEFNVVLCTPAYNSGQLVELVISEYDLVEGYVGENGP